MPIRKVKTPDGNVIKVTHPKGASDQEIMDYAKKNYKGQNKGPELYSGTALDTAVTAMSPLAQLGVEDELYGAASAIKNVFHGNPPGYEEARQRKLAQQDAMAREHPVAHMAGSVAGAVGTGAMLPGSSLKRVVAGGAALGGAAAFGKSEDDGWKRFEDAAFGVVTGAAGAGAGYGAMKTLGLVGHEARNMLLEVSDLLKIKSGNAAKVSERAVRKVMGALDKDDIGIDQLDRIMRKGVSIFDPKRKKVSSLAETVALYPGAKDIVEKSMDPRAAQSFKNMSRDIADIAIDGVEPEEIIESIMKVGRVASKEVYDEALKVKPVVDVKMQKLLGTKYGKKAYTIGRDLFEADVAMGKVDPKTHPFALMDNIVQGFDDQMSTLRDPLTRTVTNKREFARLSQMRSQFDGILKGQNKLYRKAKAISGDYLSNTEAVEYGLKFDAPKISHGNLVERMRKMSASEKASLKSGVLSKLNRNIENSKSNMGRIKPFKSVDDERKVLSVLGPKDFKKLKKRMVEEDQFFQAYNKILGNSRTAGRTFAKEAFEADTELMGTMAQQGSLTTRGFDFFRKKIMTKFDGLNEETAEEVAEFLFSKNPGKQATILKAMKNRANIGDSNATDGLNIIGGAYDSTKSALRQYVSRGPVGAIPIGMSNAVTVNSGEQ